MRYDVSKVSVLVFYSGFHWRITNLKSSRTKGPRTLKRVPGDLFDNDERPSFKRNTKLFLRISCLLVSDLKDFGVFNNLGHSVQCEIELCEIFQILEGQQGSLLKRCRVPEGPRPENGTIKSKLSTKIKNIFWNSLFA